MLCIDVAKRREDFTLDVRIEVPTPGTIALFGRSGCGKTTLINAIAGLLEPDRGRIALDDVVFHDSSTKINVPIEARRIGYVFQESRLFPHLDVNANLRYGERRATAAPHFVKFDHVVELLGLATLLERRAHELSGGERQRVALGRALLSQPRLMLLDEPLAAHVGVMERGSVAAQGSLEAVSRHPALREIIGDEAIGAVVTGSITSCDPITGLASVAIGDGVLQTHLPDAKPGAAVRVQLLARDIILAARPVEGLSVRNTLAGTIARIEAEDEQTELIEVDIGHGAIVLARVTRAASTALALREGLPLWVLVKSVSIRGHAFRAPIL